MSNAMISYEEEYEEEELGDCGGFGYQLYAFGSEQCEWCPLSDECMKLLHSWIEKERKR